MPRSLTLVLPEGVTSEGYEQQFAAGYRADRHPYGVEHLPHPWRLRFWEGGPKRGGRSLPGRVVRRLAGFDPVDAWRRRRDLRAADVLYGHTESEWMPIAFALLAGGHRKQVLLGQTVWMFDEFDRLPAHRRWILHRLASRVDVFVHNSIENEAAARRRFPTARHAYVPFGVSATYATDPHREPGRLVLSVGGDRARDWAMLDEALRAIESIDVRIASDSRIEGFEYARVARTASVDELRRLHREAACMVVTTQPNRHASGITAILEAAAAGTPIIATEDAGLRAYFDDGEVLFVPRDSGAVRAAVEVFLADPVLARGYGDRARIAWAERGYDDGAYWRRVLAVLGPSA